MNAFKLAAASLCALALTTAGNVRGQYYSGVKTNKQYMGLAISCVNLEDRGEDFEGDRVFAFINKCGYEVTVYWCEYARGERCREPNEAMVIEGRGEYESWYEYERSSIRYTACRNDFLGESVHREGWICYTYTY